MDILIKPKCPSTSVIPMGSCAHPHCSSVEEDDPNMCSLQLDQPRCWSYSLCSLKSTFGFSRLLH
ncbi:hypothetical protein Lalb_Chr08g0230431 [Lupinus albus]|uniref:Uncharacterized protein n=1 Tax=Lupinus albus TaxID=3870 RepID=A0A6A4Q349_LUPAL|nr:hypothetical protein Lalb_Chr08g0230431 [Lupinus albus]